MRVPPSDNLGDSRRFPQGTLTIGGRHHQRTGDARHAVETQTGAHTTPAAAPKGGGIRARRTRALGAARGGAHLRKRKGEAAHSATGGGGSIKGRRWRPPEEAATVPGSRFPTAPPPYPLIGLSPAAASSRPTTRRPSQGTEPPVLHSIFFPPMIYMVIQISRLLLYCFLMVSPRLDTTLQYIAFIIENINACFRPCV